MPVTDSLAIARHVPDSRLMVFDECGHFPMYEQPKRYLEAVRSWVT